MNVKEKIWIGVTVALLFVPAVLSSVNPENSSAEFENRQIEPFPPVPTSLKEFYKWPSELDAFIESHLFQRNTIIQGYNKTAYERFGMSTNKNVIIGKDNWLFISQSGHAIEKHRGIYTFTSEKQKQKWIQKLNQIAASIKQKNSDFVFVIIPSKSTVYPEYLPLHHTVVGPSLTDSIVEMLQEKADFDWIDLRPTLIRAAQSEKVFYEHDTHWNVRGSYIAYHEVMKKIESRHSVQVLDSSRVLFSQRTKMGGDLSRLLGLQNVFYEEVPNVTIEKSIVTSKKDGDYRKNHVTVTTSQKKLAKALILCDSFVFSSMSQYLQESFSCVVYKHHHSLNFDQKIIDEVNPDIVLVMVTERLLPVEIKDNS
jgi:hypothetical protein